MTVDKLRKERIVLRLLQIHVKCDRCFIDSGVCVNAIKSIKLPFFGYSKSKGGCYEYEISLSKLQNKSFQVQHY